MDNIIANLAAKATTESATASAKPGFNMGTPAYVGVGHDIFAQYVADQETSKMDALERAALDIGLTCAEFDEAIKTATKLADEADKTAGFEPPEGAKGAEKYGPKRRVLNQRMSEARQIFGVLKMEPGLIEGKGYWQALSSAREFLKTSELKWDGARNDEASKQRVRDAKTTQKAMIEAMEANPMEPGESIADYNLRIAAAVEENIEEAKEKTYAESVAKCVGKMIQDNPVRFCDDVALNILAQSEPADIVDHIMALAGKLSSSDIAGAVKELEMMATLKAIEEHEAL